MTISTTPAPDESLNAALEAYDYAFPKRAVAEMPASPRDSAKLLVYDRASGTTEWTTVLALADHLPPGTVLVRNITKVMPARLFGTRATGGRVEFLVTTVGSETFTALGNRRLHVGEELTIGRHYLTVASAPEGGFVLRPAGITPKALLARHGVMPLPPYMKRSPLSERERRMKYQSVFAAVPGSIAAPTASLHFTPRLIARLRRRGVTFVDVVLHVNLGTFAPLTPEQWRSGRLHREWFSISPKTVQVLQKAKKSGRPIVAIGTTALRAVESAASGKTLKQSGWTDLFIREGYRPKFVSGLMTNFHVPRSSLLMLVGALVGRETILKLYRQAIRRKFRLFSFGDAMIIR